MEPSVSLQSFTPTRSQCPRPRKLVLRRRKVRRKLIRDDKERLQQRRRFLSTLSKPDEVQEEDEVIQQEEDRKTVNDITEDDIERNPTRKKQAYENAIEKLRSLGKIRIMQNVVFFSQSFTSDLEFEFVSLKLNSKTAFSQFSSTLSFYFGAKIIKFSYS